MDGSDDRPRPENASSNAIDEQTWAHALAQLDIAAATVLHVSASDPARRTYRLDDTVWKLVLLHHSASTDERGLSLSDEFSLVESLRQTKGIPRTMALRETDDATAAGYSHIGGNAIDEIDGGVGARISAVFRLAIVLWRVSLQGVCHNDIKCRNVLVSEQDRSVWLIDFDQAARSSRWRALRSNFLGHKTGPASAYPSSFLRVARRVWRKRHHVADVEPAT